MEESSAMPRTVAPDDGGAPLLGTPRCGAVQRAVWAPVMRVPGGHLHTLERRQMEVALKNLDLALMAADGDEWRPEAAAMARMQPRGMREQLRRGHLLRWDMRLSGTNFYLLTERADETLRDYVLHVAPTLLVMNAADTSVFRRHWLSHTMGNLVPQLLTAVADMHWHEIAHLDLCPINVMLKFVDGEQRLKLIDFGSASLLDQEQVGGAPLGFIMLLQRHKMKMAAPGIDRRSPVDAKAIDLYMCGLIAYFLVMTCFLEAVPADMRQDPYWMLNADANWNGKLLVHVDTGGEGCGSCFLCHLQRTYPHLALGERGAMLPAWVLAVLARMLRPDPAQRGTAQGIIHMLEAGAA